MTALHFMIFRNVNKTMYLNQLKHIAFSFLFFFFFFLFVDVVKKRISYVSII